MQIASAPVRELRAGRRTAGTEAFAVMVALELVMVVSLARRGRSRRAREADR